jgi:signal transduction histidine kinase
MATGRQSVLTRRGVDALFVALAAGSVGEAIARRDAATAVVCALALTLPLLLWRLAPFAAAIGVFVAAASVSFFEHHLVTQLYTALLAAIGAGFLLGAGRERVRSLAGLALAYVLLVVIVHNDPQGAARDAISPGLLITAAWVAGLALRQKREQAEVAEEHAARLERERDLREREARAEERARIARELHDVVAHNVSVMTIQAAAVRRLLRRDQERQREALEVIERTGREALSEMRRLVGVLKEASEQAPELAPQPGLDHLEQLVQHTRETGLDVRLRVEGTPTALPVGIDVSAYRIVQEGLTNALKHAQASAVDVLVRYEADAVELVVTDDGRGTGNGSESGHGLVGMRERVAVYGGELAAGPRREGGYEVRARLPVQA